MTPEPEERRLLVAIGVVVFVDTMLYAVLTPLLPQLVHGLHLSKLSAGVLTASYAIGTLVASIPGGILAARLGPRRTVCIGLSLLMCSTVAFGLLHAVIALDAARFVEGVGGACSWAGGLAWLVDASAPERRGARIGQALGVAIAGALLGPVVGTVATAVGRSATFLVLAAGVGALVVFAIRLPAGAPTSRQGVHDLVRALRSPAVLSGIWLVALPAVVSGTLSVLGPLRLHRFGAAAVVIGATFLAGAAAEGLVTPLAGGLSDRHGRVTPMRIGLVGSSVVLVLFTLPRSVAPAAIVLVLIEAAIGFFWAPAMALLSEAAEERGLDQGLAAALMNLAWAGGQILGSAGGGALAKSAGDVLPIDLAAGLFVLTFVALSRLAGLRRAAVAGASG